MALRDVGRPKKENGNVGDSNNTIGNTNEYFLRRLARDNPELLNKIESGELTVNQAATTIERSPVTDDSCRQAGRFQAVFSGSTYSRLPTSIPKFYGFFITSRNFGLFRICGKNKEKSRFRTGSHAPSCMGATVGQRNWPETRKTLGKPGFLSGEDRNRTTRKFPGEIEV